MIFISEDSKNIMTEFYIKCNEVSFPYDNWTDFTIPVLNMWFNNLINNSEIQKLDFILYFMDGPYKLVNFLLYTNGLHEGRFSIIYSENIVSMKKIKEKIKKNQDYCRR